MSANCFIKKFKSEALNYRLPVFFQTADFSDYVSSSVGYSKGYYWKDNEEAKNVSSICCAIEPISLPDINNGIIVSSKDTNYVIAKLSVKADGVYFGSDSYTSTFRWIDFAGANVYVYITIKRADNEEFTDDIDIASIIEVKTMTPTLQPYTNNPVIRAKFVIESSEGGKFNQMNVGDFAIFNYNSPTIPYKLTVKNHSGGLKQVPDGDNKTVICDDKIYQKVNGVWVEIEE